MISWLSKDGKVKLKVIYHFSYVLSIDYTNIVEIKLIMKFLSSNMKKTEVKGL